ncbi:MAG TPA: hypothetical protein VLK25_05015 [Allosphingosinicella sp.]|nr:hypothetical protein [Allosphingosinicella sp.]
MAMHISFAPNRELPFVFGDLFQVSSKLSHYRLGGIQQISSVISGQYAENKQIHEETTQTEYYSEEEQLSEKEASHLESTHEGMQQALSETVASSQKINVSAEAEATYGVIRAQVSGGYDNDKSKSQSKTAATDFAHEVVDQSRELVRQRTLSSRRSATTVLDRTENVRGFDNRGGPSSAFITRYVEEVHRFSVVQHEQHLFAHFYISFPAANYFNAIDAGMTNPKVGVDVPGELKYLNASGASITLRPGDISLDPNSATYWFKLAVAFGLTEPTSPPGNLSDIVTIKITPDQLTNNSAHLIESVTVPEGYATHTVTVAEEANQTWIDGHQEGMDYHVVLLAGPYKHWLKLWHDPPGNNKFGVALNIPMIPIDSGEFNFVLRVGQLAEGSYSFYFVFRPTEDHLGEWRLRFFQELANAKAGKAQGPDMMAAAGAGVTVADLRSSPIAAERMIKQELRREAIRFVTGSDLDGLDPVNRKARPFPHYPLMDVAKANDLQPIYDFLHTGFDFDKMSFTFLPTWLGAMEQRYNAFAGGATGMMTEFLNAGAAEIVLPVRSGREEQLFFFQKTGIIFDGSDVPLPDDPATLALYDEILEARELNASPKSIEIKSWDDYLPTPHVILQASATMPDFRPGAPPDPGTVAGNSLAPKLP